MYRKFLRTSVYIGILIVSSNSVHGVQRFVADENAVVCRLNNRSIPSKWSTLTYRGIDYEPSPNRRAKGWVEWNIAPDNSEGPVPIYGETVTATRFTNQQYSYSGFFGVLSGEKLTSGYPKVWPFKAKLKLNGNPECVVLYWNDKIGGLDAIEKK